MVAPPWLRGALSFVVGLCCEAAQEARGVIGLIGVLFNFVLLDGS